MASFLNSWVQGIVIAIVLATVLEMLLPEGNNKKYVKILIGIYILFTIISPVMNKAGKIEVKNSILDTKQYQKEIEKYSVDTNTMQEQNQKSIQTIYQQNLKSDMTNKLEEKGYQVNAVHIRVSNEGDYLLEEVRLQLTKAENKEKEISKKQNVIAINVVTIEVQEEKQEQEKTENTLEEAEIQEIKEYLTSVYEVKEKLGQVKAMMVKKTEGNPKKTIENLVVFVIILVVTIVAINMIWKEDKQNPSKQDDTKVLAQKNQTIQEKESQVVEQNELEQKLEAILSKIEGAGNVEVLITYSQSSELVPVYNESSTVSTTEESDQQGGTRRIEENTTQKEVIYEENSGQKELVTQKVINPKVEGAIILAEGAEDSTVKTNIVQAVEAVTGIATHKIQVFTSKPVE